MEQVLKPEERVDCFGEEGVRDQGNSQGQPAISYMGNSGTKENSTEGCRSSVLGVRTR